MVTLLKTRRTWKRATVRQSPSFFKENIDQKIEKTIFDGKTALAITYKKNIHLKDITFLKRSVQFLCDAGLPFSNLYSFEHSKEGYRVFWSFCEGKIRPDWSLIEFEAFGDFLGKMHSISRLYKKTDLGKVPLVISLREKYEHLKDFIPESFDLIPKVLKQIEDLWPIFLSTGLVHTDLFPTNILFKHNSVSGILQNHHLQMDVLLYDLASVIKTLYFTPCENKDLKEKAFFSAYNAFNPLSIEEMQNLPVLTAAKFLHTCLTLIEKHLSDSTYSDAYLNGSAISLIHAEKALLLFR